MKRMQISSALERKRIARMITTPSRHTPCAWGALVGAGTLEGAAKNVFDSALIAGGLVDKMDSLRGNLQSIVGGKYRLLFTGDWDRCRV